MTQAITKQKIRRRGNRHRNIEFIQLSPQRTGRRKRKKVSPSKSAMKPSITGQVQRVKRKRVNPQKTGPLNKWLKRVGRFFARLKKLSSFSFVAVAATAVLVAVLFFSSSIPGSGMTESSEVTLPQDRAVEQLLLEYIEPENEQTGGADIKLPPASILSSINPDTYEVKRGDTLSEIAAEYEVSLSTLLSFNNISDVRKIRIGTELSIPPLNGTLYTVKPGDSLSLISYRNNVSLNDILDANGLESSVIRSGQELFLPGGKISDFELKKATGELFLYPTAGRLSSGYGMRNDPFTGVRRMHYGIDLANRIGTPVKAAMAGTVATVGINHKGYGRYVILNHTGGFQTLYAHLDTAAVKKGEKVRQGQVIGEMGNTGRSTGPHLHFSIYRYQKPVNPSTYLF